jgi:hypothetical protein
MSMHAALLRLGLAHSARLMVEYPRRYLLVEPAWLECYRWDWKQDIEAEVLLDGVHAQREAADAARRES